MRKIYAILAMLVLANSSFGQAKRLTKTISNQSRKESFTPFVRDNYDVKKGNFTSYSKLQTETKKPMPISSSAKSMWLWEQVIGSTTYDNQSNNSVQPRIIVDNNDQVHATWTMSHEMFSTTWTDRGTGYNSGAGYIWGDEPYDRQESQRSGWPGLMLLGDNSEAFICHTSTGPVSIVKRATVGSGNWTMTPLPTALTNDFLWPRSVAEGNTIHVIALSAPSGLDGTAINGVDGNLIYWRSNDNGATWSVQDHIFSQIDPAEFDGINSDSYAIDAKGNNVSIAIFCEEHDSVLLTSTDGGDTWSSTIFYDFPIAGYSFDEMTDVGNDGVIDTMNTTDGTGALIIDSNGISHVAFGQFDFFDDTPGDSLYTTFPLGQNLIYWNSTMATNELYVIGTVEENANDADDIFNITLDNGPDYRAALASMPSFGEDANGNVYCVFSAADEEYLGDQVFRHLYATMTSDGGTTWAAQVELTPDLDFNEYEYTFPSLCKTVNESLHIVVQRDTEPGLNVRGDLDISEENDIVYLAVTTDFDITINTPEVTPGNGEFTVYPNPSQGVITIMGDNLSNATMRVYNALGQEMLCTKLGKNFNATDKQSFDLSFLPAGKYTVAVGHGKNRMSKEVLIQK